MHDTMRAMLEKIRADETAPSDDAVKADRARAPDGKFAKQEAVAPVADQVAAPTDQATSVVAPAAPADQVAAPTEAVVAPSSWTGPAKAEFAKASPIIQQEVLRREQQMHNGIAQYKEAANYGQEIFKTLQPYEQNIRAANVTPAVAIREMFAVDHALRNGSPQEKINVLANVARNYGIDLSQGMPQAQPIDPNFQHLQNQLQTTQQQLQQITAERQNQEQSALNSQIEAAKEGRPHFDNLRLEMAALIQAAHENGEKLELNDAYDRAVWAHPTYRAEMLTKQQADQAKADAAQRAEAAAKVAAAAVAAKAAASTNVAKRGTLQAQGAVGTMQDTMRETLERIRSR